MVGWKKKLTVNKVLCSSWCKRRMTSLLMSLIKTSVFVLDVCFCLS
jgi:hypothetical protein